VANSRSLLGANRKKRLDDDVVRALIAVISSPASLLAAPSEELDRRPDRRPTTTEDMEDGGVLKTT
jgi:hypothetical protein